MKFLIAVIAALLVIPSTGFTASNPNRIVDVNYNIEIWQPGTLVMNDCSQNNMHFSFDDSPEHIAPTIQARGYVEDNCTVTISGKTFRLQVVVTLDDMKPNATHPNGFKTLTSFFGLYPVDEGLMGTFSEAYTDLVSEQTDMSMSLYGQTQKNVNNSWYSSDMLRINISLTDSDAKK